MTNAEFDEVLCEQLGIGSYIVHVVKKSQDLTEGRVFSPIAKESPEADFKTVCAAPDLGARLHSAGTENEKLMVGLLESWGALTTQKYRAAVFKALDGDLVQLRTTLRADVEKKSNSASETCSLLKL